MKLLDVLKRSQELGFLGPEDVANHVDHAVRFEGPFLESATTAVDLGSGGGVPGLMLATKFPSIQWTLLDGSAKRCAFLREAVSALDLQNTRVTEGRAEHVARDSSMRHCADVVVARSFGAPAVVAECATGLLAVHGCLVVSEPPTQDQRWDPAGLAEFGMKIDPMSGSGVVVLRQSELCSDRWPRRNGVPTKRPIF